jgi:hypothetical protein
MSRHASSQDGSTPVVARVTKFRLDTPPTRRAKGEGSWRSL